VRVVLIDLDDTLFDHDRATRESLRAIQADGSAFAAWPLEELDRRHRALLEALHLDVLAGRLSVDDARVERFQRLLDASGHLNAAFEAPDIARRYRRVYEQSWHCVPGAALLLEAIRASRRPIVVVTNNHVAEQEEKLTRLGLRAYVDELVTSEEAGCCKPEPDIFHQALARVGAAPGDAVMLGDAWATDIEGARAAGVRAVWLNRFDQPCPDSAVAQLTSLEPCDAAMRVLEGSR
jgi:putative hydrolase of the HAD superfamily